MCFTACLLHCRICEAMKTECNVIDVDGSYVFHKLQLMEQEGKNVALLGIPPPRFSAWEPVTEGNYSDKIPQVTQRRAFRVGVVANIITFRNGVHLRYWPWRTG